MMTLNRNRDFRSFVFLRGCALGLDARCCMLRNAGLNLLPVVLMTVVLLGLAMPAQAQLADVDINYLDGQIRITGKDNDEYYVIDHETWAADSVAAGVPTEATQVLQVWVQLDDGNPAKPVWIAGNNVTTEERLEEIELDSVEVLEILAEGGDDWIETRLLSDNLGGDLVLLLRGGDGDDVLLGGPASDILDGGLGNDYVDGGAGDNEGEEGLPGLSGGDGDDYLIGGAGNDFLSGGAGNDVIQPSCGDDALDGGTGYDVADYSNSTNIAADLNAIPQVVKKTDPCKGTDKIGGFEVFRGSGLADTIKGDERGSNTILGGGGNDIITGGKWEDLLFGESGNDEISSTDGWPDVMIGGSGNDTITGTSHLNGDILLGDGFEFTRSKIGPVGQEIVLHDQAFIRLTPHPLSTLVGREILILSSSPVGTLNPGPGVLNIQNLLQGYGTDEAVYADNDYLLPARDGLPNSLGEIDIWPGRDTITGGAGADRIAGGGGGDIITGDGHSDLIFGDHVPNRAQALAQFGNWGPHVCLAADVMLTYYGNDKIEGGDYPDTILGGGGWDLINGGTFSDVIYGDWYFNDATSYDVTVQPANLPAGSTGFDDRINGGPAETDSHGDFDIIFGGPGNDTLLGGKDRDVLMGNTGNDWIVGGQLLPHDPNEKLDNDGFIKSFIYPDIDYDSGDAVDYHLVPSMAAIFPGAVVGTGINLELGDFDHVNDVTGNLGSTFATIGGLHNDSQGDGEFVGGWIGTDTLVGIDNVVGTVNHDVIAGNHRNDESVTTGRWNNTFLADSFYSQRFPTGVQNPDRGGWDNILVGLEGDDLIIGRRGQDALAGNDGNDVIWGDNITGNPNGNGPDDGTGPGADNDAPDNEGHDELWGDLGNDQLHGEFGHDILRGGPGEDFLSGGAGDDVLDYSEDFAPTQYPIISPGVVVNLRAEDMDVTVLGDLATRYNLSFNPVGTLTPLPGGTRHFPGEDPETLDGTACGAGTFQCAGTASDGSGSLDTIANNQTLRLTLASGAEIIAQDFFEIVRGSGRSDVIWGNQILANTLFGDDWRLAQSVSTRELDGGNDFLIGGAADDELDGGPGSDFLEARGGDDTIIGGPVPLTPPGVQNETEYDWLSYDDVTVPADGAGGTKGVVVNLGETEPQNTQTSGFDRLVEVENVIGTDFNDVIKGNHRENILRGGDGNDLLMGRGDDDVWQANTLHIKLDTLDGGPGTDTADYRLSDPAIIADSLETILINTPNCFTSDIVDCAVANDGEGGSDELVKIEGTLEPDQELTVTVPDDKVISPDESVVLTFSATGGNPTYKAVFDPTTDVKVADEDDEDESPFVLPPETVSIINPTEIAGLTFGQSFSTTASPLATTLYRVTVTDMQDAADQLGDDPAARVATGFVTVTVADELEVTIDQEEYIIGQGESVQLLGRASGGITPYTIAWTANDGSQGTTLSATNILIPIASPTKTTTYTVTVTDSAPDSAPQVVAAQTVVTVLSGGSASGAPTPGGSSESSSSGSGGTVNANEASDGASNSSGSSDGNEQTLGAETESGAPQPAAVPPLCGFGLSSGFVMLAFLGLVAMRRRV